MITSNSKRFGDMTEMNRSTVVLGLGNPLMGDDGVGLVALETLRRNYDFAPDVQLEDGGTLGLALLPLVEEADSLLVLDAVRLGGHPGTTVVLQGEQIPRGLSLKVSPHQAGFLEVLALAGLRGRLPARLTLIGMEIVRADYACSLSPEIRGALPAMIATAVATLQSWGCIADSDHVFRAVRR